jgi:hypothetical protein
MSHITELGAYKIVSTNTGSLNTGSYLSKNDYALFVNGFTGDLWYGFSANDTIELGVFDRENNPVAWGTLHQDKRYNDRTFSYINTLNQTVTYSYEELQSDFILYKNFNILVSTPEELSQSFGIVDGSYSLTYNFVREMAGTPNESLVIKDISPSRQEIKLLPIGNNTLQYQAFCQKKFLLGDISSLYIQRINACPYGKIYNQTSPLYRKEINTIKELFFLTSDGAVETFLKNLYEDLIIYTSTPTDVDGNPTGDPDQLLRIQGIRTYFNNYLRENVNSISDFNTVDSYFQSFVNLTIERKFSAIGKSPAQKYIDAKRFVYDFFTKYYYTPISAVLTSTFNEKYFSKLRNALNLGGGELFPIISCDFLDERNEETDPLTLIIKLQEEASTDIIKGRKCWISNISLVPYIVDVIIKNPKFGSTVKIGAPNFSTKIPEISKGHYNKSYSAADLENDSTITREISVSKQLSKLNIDYTNFSNFVVFSSAEVRTNIYKNKVITISSLTSSLQELENKNTAFIAASGSEYPYYTQEEGSLSGQITTIVSGFDGYESYLYRTGNYDYLGGSFISSSFVSRMDISASAYDQYNRDSLINNTPAHILEDDNNDEYIVFLSMMGQFFDEIYAYITNVPSEKSLGQSETETFSRLVTDYMLEAFGWNLGDAEEQSSLINNYLSSNEISGLNSMSVEDRTKIVRNRILLNLSQIYKTKGTEESVKLLLACYGIPSTLLSIREYGGVNYTDENASYTRTERAFMYQWDSSSVYDHFRSYYPGQIHTIEYKFSIPDQSPYTYGNEQIQWGVIQGGIVSSTTSGSGQIHGGFVRERGKNLGRVFFSVGYKGVEDFKIYSDIIPLFDGNVYSVMVRRNDPDPLYEYTSDINETPTKYELYVQRNNSGRAIIQSTSSHMNYSPDINRRFDEGGYLMIGGWFYAHNRQGYTGTFDKLLLWLDAVPNSSFVDHVNDINSYAFSGSRAGYESLVYRMHTDYPFDLNQLEPLTSGVFFQSSSRWWGNWHNKSEYYANSELYQSRFDEQTGTPPYGNQFEYITSWGAWSGSQELVYDVETCLNISQSKYPFQFKVIDYPSTYTISKYGPNKFRNEKIKHISQSVSTRLDRNDRSTYVPRNQTAPDSNLLGFFVDPQDFKNKDILRYHGNFDFMDVIGSPTNTFESSYSQLKKLRKDFSNISNNVSGSNPRINELISIYKLYFNRSIFEAIQNLVPARANVLTGILIEPTILERPKYEAKVIASEANTGTVFYADITASKYFRSSDTKIVRSSYTLDFAEFNTDTSLLIGTSFNTGSLPNNLYLNIDMSYINEPNVNYPINYLDNGTNINDVSDKYQFSHFGTGNSNFMDNELGYGKMPVDMNHQAHPTASKKYYLMKQWDTYTIWGKVNDWNRTSNPNDNQYVTNSIELYKYVAVDAEWFKSQVYIEDTVDTTISNIAVGLGVDYLHEPNTFKNTPNTKRNDMRGYEVWNGTRFIFDITRGYFRTKDGFTLEIAQGYPRNHYTHKNQTFSPIRIKKVGKNGQPAIIGSYIRSQQTVTSTIGKDGLDDGTLPVQTFKVGNVNLIQSDNVINQ